MGTEGFFFPSLLFFFLASLRVQQGSDGRGVIPVDRPENAVVGLLFPVCRRLHGLLLIYAACARYWSQNSDINDSMVLGELCSLGINWA